MVLELWRQFSDDGDEIDLTHWTKAAKEVGAPSELIGKLVEQSGIDILSASVSTEGPSYLECTLPAHRGQEPALIVVSASPGAGPGARHLLQ